MFNFLRALIVVIILVVCILIVRSNANAEELTHQQKSNYTPENSVLYFDARLQSKLQWLDMSQYSEADKKVVMDTNNQLSKLREMLEKKGFVLQRKSSHFPRSY